MSQAWQSCILEGFFKHKQMINWQNILYSHFQSNRTNQKFFLLFYTEFSSMNDHLCNNTTELN